MTEPAWYTFLFPWASRILLGDQPRKDGLRECRRNVWAAAAADSTRAGHCRAAGTDESSSSPEALKLIAVAGGFVF